MNPKHWMHAGMAYPTTIGRHIIGIWQNFGDVGDECIERKGPNELSRLVYTYIHTWQTCRDALIVIGEAGFLDWKNG